MPDQHVELADVTKRFGGGAVAVDSVSLSIPRGSFTTLLGPSGCGKTTLLRLLAGLYEPDTGDILISGQRVNPVPAHRRKVTMVFQDYALFPHMTVAENVAYGLKVNRVRREEAAGRVDATLDLLGLGGLGGRLPGQLSGGQQQRVAIARALVINPEVLLLDEPLSNLDAKLRVSVREEIVSLQRRLGITTVYVTHDQREALAMSDWIAVMQQGKVEQWGTPEDIYYRPATAFVADFIGSVNLVHAEVDSGAEILGERQITVRLGEARLTLPLEGACPAGDRVLLSIRPESLRMVPLHTATNNGRTVLKGTVISRTFLGNVTRYVVQVGEYEWAIEVPDPKPGEFFSGSVGILLDPKRVHVVSRSRAGGSRPDCNMMTGTRSEDEVKA